ncbi:MAG: HD domain-containing protein [Candidatus Omnitrophica bacterium]|nr:HD domain-containing protein [Candidatus Omnitrophota bacterium]
MNQRELKRLLNFITEAGMLKRVRRSGWWVLGIKDVETVAEHSFRCAVLGYIIARMEKVSPYHALLMTLFNDIQEARINDLHKMSQRYFKYQKAENKAFDEQIQSLPKDIKDELGDMRREYLRQKTPASIIARDADILECLIQAKEYQEHGFKEAFKFMRKAPSFLKTKSAKKLWRSAKNADLNKWWENLSEFKR